MAEKPPTYDELVELLRQAPPREQIVEDRYWAYRRKVDAMLARLPR